jgi:EmrB/QacA subfamily drug resistance transporter
MRRYLIFVCAGLALLMYSIDSTVVAVAFPNFIRELGSNVLWTGWTISIFLIGVASTMPLAGNLSDTFGRKRIFLISLCLFTFSSLACGLAPNIHALIVFRFLQGIGGASFLPSASGIVADHFPESRERAIGLFTSIFPIGGIIGPNLGGWIVSRYSWRYVFYINLPVGIVLIVMTIILLENSRVLSRPRVDVAGASFMSGALFFLMLALSLVGEHVSTRSVLFASVLLMVSLCLVLLFFRQETREDNPILDMLLLRSTPFLAANLVNLVIGAGVMGIFAFIPLYVTSIHGFSTLMSGIILTPRSVGMIAASAIVSFLLRRWGYRWPIALGLAVTALSTILLAPSLPPWGMSIRRGDAQMLSVLLLIAGIGLGVMFPAANNACIELMPERVATIVALRNTFRTVGGALGISLITLILHLSRTPANGFRLTFISFGFALLCSIPLVFLMPSGKGSWDQGKGAINE